MHNSFQTFIYYTTIVVMVQNNKSVDELKWVGQDKEQHRCHMYIKNQFHSVLFFFLAEALSLPKARQIQTIKRNVHMCKINQGQYTYAHIYIIIKIITFNILKPETKVN